MYKHLLVPTDGTELSNHALNQATALARCLGARITVLYVQEECPQPVVADGFTSAGFEEDFVRNSAEAAQSILSQARAVVEQEGVACFCRTATNASPWQEIVHTAQLEGCDLIFMASHGRTGLSGLIIGSETHKVITHCKIPVLVCR
ncbi:universal stress protein [Uliginosibacterium sediminicola]|uniref:Universal stress protein n=1 Tax=Uliginosibacterium sediminicola TaxID=2024550 RepID=A0ABU9Z077_9RHOO